MCGVMGEGGLTVVPGGSEVGEHAPTGQQSHFIWLRGSASG